MVYAAVPSIVPVVAEFVALPARTRYVLNELVPAVSVRVELFVNVPFTVTVVVDAMVFAPTPDSPRLPLYVNGNIGCADPLV